MECKGCNTPITEETAKKVGEWFFCPPCFEDLLAGKPGKKEPVPEAAPEPPPLVLKGEQKACTVCSKPLSDGEGHDLGILTVCPDCYAEMTARPEPVKIGGEEPDEPDPSSVQRDEPVPDPMATTACTACGRTIKQVGAKVFEDNPYCPDCFYKNNYNAQAQ